MVNKKTQKKIILFALPSLHIGGIERHIIKQFKHFDTDRYEFHLLTFFHNEGSANLYDQVPDNVQVHRFVFSIGVDLKNTWRLLKFLRQLRPDLVVSSMVFPNTIMRALKPLVGYKVIAREHNTYSDKTLRHKVRDHICSYFSETIVAVSEMVADYASKQAKIPKNKFTVIQNGVDIDEIEKFKESSGTKVKELYQEFSLSTDTKIVLNVARLKPQKNHSLLVHSFVKFIESNTNYVLFILGGGSDGRKIKQVISDLGMEDKIILAGYREDVFTFYKASDFFILTSDIEGFPNVAVEAMAFGLPVLSTMVAGIDEIVDDGVNGFLLEREPASVCDMMTRIAKTDIKKREIMSKESIKTAKKYSIEKNVHKYQNLFESVLK